MKYNRREIMTAANTYAKTMTRSQALRYAWGNAKRGNSVEALYLTPDQFQYGDHIAIEVGARWGEVHFIHFARILREYEPGEVVMGSIPPPGWPENDDGFILDIDKRYVVERAA